MLSYFVGKLLLFFQAQSPSKKTTRAERSSILITDIKEPAACSRGLETRGMDDVG